MLIGFLVFLYFSRKAIEQPEPGDLVIGTQFDMETVDPRKVISGPALAPKFLIFEPLVFFDEHYILRPLLLTSWTSSVDAKTCTLNLKHGITFSDGTPFNADAVKFTIQYMINARPSFKNIQSIETVNSHTVRVLLTRPYASFMQDISFIGMMSPSCVTSNGSFSHPVGCGPFTIHRYRKKQCLVLVRNETYHGPAPAVKRVFLKLIPDHNTRAMALESGEIDIADYLPISLIQKFRNNPGFNILQRSGPCPCWIGFNVRREPFNDIRVRKAVNHAIDISTIVNSLINRDSHLATPALRGPHSQELYKNIVNPHLKWYEFNREKARTLFEAAGWIDRDGDGIRERNGKPFRVQILSSRLYPENGRILEAVQGQLKKCGILVDINTVESAARFQAYRRKQYDMIELSGICPHNDPTLWYQYFFHSVKQPTYCVMKDPAIDRTIDALSATVNTETRKELLFTLQEFLEKNVPGIFLYIPDQVVVYSSKLKQFKMNCGVSGTYSYAKYASKTI